MAFRYGVSAEPRTEVGWHIKLMASRKANGLVTSNDLAQQLADPRHCHVEVSPGRLFSHNSSDPHLWGRGLAGKPVRFSLLAAGRVVEELRRLGFNQARVVWIVEGQG